MLNDWYRSTDEQKRHDSRRWTHPCFGVPLQPMRGPPPSDFPICSRPAESTHVTDKTPSPKFEFRTSGWCPLCGNDTDFIAVREKPIPEQWFPNWFRDGLLCVSCGSIPRDRALFTVVEMFYPGWRDLRMHESSPSNRGASRKFRTGCASYVASQYDPVLGFGNLHPSQGYRSEDLEEQTFAGESFDMVLTQDVFEHLFAPDRAIREIARTLRPGGAHILTVPIVNGTRPSQRRARRDSAGISFLAEAQYHGNPMSGDGSLVTIDWGYDIVDYLSAHSGLSVSMVYIDDLSRGLRASRNEVLICRKLLPPQAL